MSMDLETCIEVFEPVMFTASWLITPFERLGCIPLSDFHFQALVAGLAIDKNFVVFMLINQIFYRNMMQLQILPRFLFFLFGVIDPALPFLVSPKLVPVVSCQLKSCVGVVHI